MKSIQRSLPVLVLLLVSLLVTACAAPPNVTPANVSASPTPLPMPSAMATEAASAAASAVEMPATSADLTGASLYQLSCAACHGQDRAGSTFEMDGQTVKVPELTWDDLNKMYSTNVSRGNVHDQLVLAITKGQNEDGEDMNAMMPRWSSLTQGQVDSLIQYLQTAGTAAGAAPTLEPAATNLMGEQLYVTACAACHGVDGAGKTFEMDGQTIKTPALTWDDLNKMYSTDPSRGNVHDQLVLAITKGQDEEGGDMPSMMPRWSSLSQAQVDSLIQYIQSTFK